MPSLLHFTGGGGSRLEQALQGADSRPMTGLPNTFDFADESVEVDLSAEEGRTFRGDAGPQAAYGTQL